MKKSLLSLFLVIVAIFSMTVVTVYAANEYRISKSQLKDYSGKTGVITNTTQLKDAYSLTWSSDSDGTYTNIFMPLNFVTEVTKGDIVIVLEEVDSLYRVTIPTMGDAGIVSGFLEKRYVSYDANLIRNANQCSFRNVVGYDAQTNQRQTISGNSRVYERANGKLLVMLGGGDSRRFWIEAKDASFNFDRIATDISMDAYRSIIGQKPSLTTVELKVTMNKLQYTINGVPAMFDVAPYLDTKANRSMIPMRFIAEAFGATVTWDDKTKTQTIMLNGKTFKLTQNVPLPDGMGTPVLKQDRFFVPLRYVSQELGASVDWDNATQTNTIIYHK